MIRKRSQPVNSLRSQSLRSCQSARSENVMSKVPHKIRSSLQQKSKEESTNVQDLINKFKSVFTAEKCQICYLAIKYTVSLADCEHKFCQQCLLRYVMYKIDSMEEILCPNQGCDRKIQMRSQFYQNLPQNYKQKHRKQQLWKQTMKNPDLKLCPFQECKQGIVNMRKIPPECQKCGSRFCQQCMMKEHEGTACQQNFKELFQELKRCPGCRIFIQKTEGCNHMTCRCGHEFCFVCSVPWSQPHYSCGQLDLMNVQQFRYPKLFAVLLILLVPFLVLLSVLVVGISTGLLIIAGFFGAVFVFINYYFSIKCFLCVIVAAPFVGVAGAVVATVVGIGYFIGIYIVSRFCQYFTIIRRLWQQPN